MIVHLKLFLVSIFVLFMTIASAQQHNQVEYIRITQNAWFESPLIPTYICKQDSYDKLKNSTKDIKHMYQIYIVSDTVYDNLIKYMVSSKIDTIQSKSEHCINCYEILSIGSNLINYNTRSELETEKYFYGFLKILLQNSNKTHLNNVIKNGILKDYKD